VEEIGILALSTRCVMLRSLVFHSALWTKTPAVSLQQATTTFTYRSTTFVSTWGYYLLSGYNNVIIKRHKSSTKKGKGEIPRKGSNASAGNSTNNDPQEGYSSSPPPSSSSSAAASSPSFPPAPLDSNESVMDWNVVQDRFRELQVPGASLPDFVYTEQYCSITLPVQNKVKRSTLVLYFAEKAIETGLLVRASDLDISFRSCTKNGASLVVGSSFQVDIWGEENGNFPTNIRYHKQTPYLLKKELDILLNAYEACHSTEAFNVVTNLDIYDTLGKYLQRLESKVHSLFPNVKKTRLEEDEDNTDSFDRIEKLERKVTKHGASLFFPEESYSWDMLAGYRSQKEKIEEAVVLPLVHRDIFEKVSCSVRKSYRSPIPKAVLLEGPPGTGKTTVAKILASRGNIPLVHVTMEAITSKWYGDSEKKLSKLLQVSNEYGPCFVFLDEIDSFLGDRSSMHEATRRTLSVLLRHLDGLTSSLNKSILIAATNRKNDLDAALLSRFDETIHFELPDIDTRAEIIHLYATHLSQEDLYSLASMSKEFSGRNISDACKEVERSWATKIVKGEQKLETLPPAEEYLKVFSRRQANNTKVSSLRTEEE